MIKDYRDGSSAACLAEAAPQAQQEAMREAVF
jgi:hypothetical protein